MPHLLAVISPHGFGHLVQTAAVLNPLYARVADLEITVRTTLPRERIATRLHVPFAHDRQADDFGMQQISALEVDLEASARAYSAFHQDWEKRLADVARQYESLAPDLVFANVPYLSLAAARAAQIPAIGMSVLNWAEIYWHYFQNRPEAKTIHRQMLEAYHAASVFMTTEPAMPMRDFKHTRPIGPVVVPGNNRRAVINERFRLSAEEQLVLVGLGGIAMRLPVERWPSRPGLRYIVQEDWRVQRGDVITLESLAMPFSDVLASCDLFLTKPGYGSFTEAAANGIPVLYVTREDWPEQAYLVEWLEQRASCKAISPAQADEGRFSQELEWLLAAGTYPAMEATGVEQANEVLADALK